MVVCLNYDVNYKIILVPVPFTVVTMFKTDGTHKKCQWPNSAHIMFALHALLLWHTCLHTYLLRTPPRCSVEMNVFELG